MKNIMKRILRNPILDILFALVLLGTFYYFLIYAPNHFLNLSNEPFMRCIMTQVILFFVFMLLSYMIFYENNRKGIHENRKIFWKGAFIQDVQCFLVLIGTVVLTVLFAGIFFFCFYHRISVILTGGMVVYIIRFLVLYLALPMFIAILAGRVSAMIENRLRGLTVLFFLFYLFGFGFIGMMFDMFSYRNYPGWRFTTLFCLMHFDPGCMYDLNYLASMEPMQWYRAFFWIFLFGGFFLLGMLKKKWLSLLPFGMAFVSLVLYFQPSGAMMSFQTSSGFDYVFQDYWYYYNNQTCQEYTAQSKNDFTVITYDMNLTISDILKADVAVELNEASLDEYQFTLYHGYQIKSITDGDGDALPYTRVGDYILVKNEKHYLKEIRFTYSGYSSNFYSTTQGIYLPANFEYYPRAGWTPVYNNDHNFYTPDVPDTLAEFRVKLFTKGKYPLFCNVSLKECGKTKGFYQYELDGNTDGLTLMASPFLGEVVVDGVRVISSRFAHNEYPGYQDNEETYREVFEKLNRMGISMEGKVFFEAPHHNWDSYYLGQDSICEKAWRVAQEASDLFEWKEEENADANEEGSSGK